jgi:hypothetical protein
MVEIACGEALGVMVGWAIYVTPHACWLTLSKWEEPSVLIAPTLTEKYAALMLGAVADKDAKHPRLVPLDT